MALRRALISRWLRVVAVALVVVLAGAGLFAADSAPSGPNSPQDIIAFLKQTITWYRHLAVEQQLATDAGDLMFLNDNRRAADQVVRLSFEFATNQAQRRSEGNTEQAPADTRYQRLSDMAAQADQQAQQTATEVAGLRQKLETAPANKQRALESALAEVQSELELAQTRRDVLRSMTEFVSGANSGGGAGGLRAQIEELERSVPAASGKTSNTATPTVVEPAVTAGHRTEPSGILALITDLRTLNHKLDTLDQTIQLTDGLAQSARNMRAPFTGTLRDLVQHSNALATAADSADPATLQKQKVELDSITRQFKQISGVVLPLSKEGILLDLYKRNLVTWRGAVQAQYVAEWKSLGLRLALLALALAAVAAISEIWRRALFRYVQEPRRRHQFLVLRRIVLWFVSGMIIAFAFATELGSLATFAGLLTAGVAVALQNVILSVAGYFFLIGKYGVRIGDRVQIAGVTGEVVDIGLVRVHLMEFAGGGAGAQPTGRVVAFSNSVVFQSGGGIFKQIPGTNFVWHELTLTLAPESNYRSVEERLMGAVQSVFADYRAAMEKQRHQIERLGPVSVSTLGPQSRLRLTQGALEVVISYPLELQKAAEVDDRITRQVLDAIEREPKLKLVGSGAPNIQPVSAAAAK